ncbi:nitroreductase family protein [Candidatus Margulisiibacteriota bacterium]
MNTIYKRRSIRKFTEKKVSENLTRELIKAGMSAPSARNQQPWEFIVIDQQDIKQEVSEIHPNFYIIQGAPTAILVCGNLNREKSPDYWVQDCAATTENILLAITANKLGGVWMGVYPREDRVQGLKEYFNLPDKIIPFSLIAFGYPAEEKPAHSEFDLERIRFNKW